MIRYLLGVDLAKELDYTSFAVIKMVYPEQSSPNDSEYLYRLLALDRVRGVDYPTIIETILATLEVIPEANDGPHLCLDASGLGAPIRDYLQRSGTFVNKSQIYPVVFTGGEGARRDPTTGNYNISKSLIIGNFLSLQQHKRFRYAKDLQALPLLEQEIASFQATLDPTR